MSKRLKGRKCQTWPINQTDSVSYPVQWDKKIEFIHNIIPNKAKLLQEGIFFTLSFLPWEFLLFKNLEIEKIKTT